MYKIFIDLEMHPIPRSLEQEREICTQEIIEIGAVKLDEQNREVESFCEFVRPAYVTKIYSKFRKLTGITTENILGADPVSDVLPRFIQWCGEDYEIYSWSDSDIWQILNETRLKDIQDLTGLSYMLNHWHDFQQEFCELLHLQKQMNLGRAVTLAGLDFSGREHDGLADARTTSQLYVESRDSKSFDRLRKLVIDAFVGHSFTMGDMFDFGSITFPSE
ncbi:MAG: 3'-5' exonuclease [Eubacteriales bacterium]|nr:3'-5' exonuclease [Eubacteriales bacterium]